MFKRGFHLFFGVLLAICSGSISIYPVYSYYLKNKFGYSLREINLFGSFINIGVWAAFGIGLIYDKFGTKISLLISFFLYPIIFMLLCSFIDSTRTSLNIILLLIFALLMGQGSALLYTN